MLKNQLFLKHDRPPGSFLFPILTMRLKRQDGKRGVYQSLINRRVRGMHTNLAIDDHGPCVCYPTI